MPRLADIAEKTPKTFLTACKSMEGRRPAGKKSASRKKKVQPKAGTTAVKKKLACKPMGGLHQRKIAKAAGVQPLPEPDDENESEKSIMDESEFDDCINEPNENQSRNKIKVQPQAGTAADVSAKIKFACKPMGVLHQRAKIARMTQPSTELAESEESTD